MNATKQYGLVTANYWAFTLTDGALRMLVLLFFYQLGYSPFAIAMLFLFYEFFGIVTNLVGGWLGSRLGLNVTMNIGLAIQVIALLMLTVPTEWLGVAYVMFAQALSGIAKDLNKMSAKSSIKSLASDGDGTLYRWVTLLTGSKNALKGIGFFMGAFLLEWVGFANAMWIMAGVLSVALIASLLFLDGSLGKSKNKSKFSEMFSKSAAINWLSAARLFLFGARDVWFVVALPIYLQTVVGWSHTEVGAYIALWIIGYGMIQASTPKIMRSTKGGNPTSSTAMKLAIALAGIPFIMAWQLEVNPELIIVIGLALFGVIFALNSAVHSYLIVSAATHDGTSKDVGFYYMANAGGRLLGTVLSGYVYQVAGMEACLMIAGCFILMSAVLVLKVPKTVLN
ncbi:organoarsenical effux MFS transporter ArsJ [Thiomicrorhabdus lithotrophica]|uniref:Organoarsenical effux MFS transporter ArsJ n=1 Tax=Thiomicrorhabdus lithotrophica TaxID=2949997 RepID=A0ABY8C9S4_9GAMM|nr:organoarsenical effux MFS transporter ArsJ [Thiomicrorhabdus lithotrophica]WEJ62720.1 organoarsenical effux MFS transporter ArsJ [Thiomicrorhabdus lithotrophica]